jgi:hypothetical protein
MARTFFLILSAVFAIGALAVPAQAQPRRVEEHRDVRRDWHHDDRGRPVYVAPPVVYGTPYYNPPPVVYGPGIAINTPGITINIP